MRYRVRRFEIHQTALMAAAVYALFSLVLVPIFFFASMADSSIPGALVIFLPIVYGVLGYIGTAIGCFFYNLVAGWVGGVEMTLEGQGTAAGL